MIVYRKCASYPGKCPHVCCLSCVSPVCTESFPCALNLPHGHKSFHCAPSPPDRHQILSVCMKSSYFHCIFTIYLPHSYTRVQPNLADKTISLRQDHKNSFSTWEVQRTAQDCTSFLKCSKIFNRDLSLVCRNVLSAGKLRVFCSEFPLETEAAYENIKI